MQSKLAIAIPTYNRTEILSQGIDFILDEVIENNLIIYIVDDSQNNETFNVINDKYGQLPNIKYFKNKENLGHDRNFFKTISIVKEDYVWYIGDSMLIKKGVLSNVLNIIKSRELDFIILNEESRNISMPDQLFVDYKLVIEKIGWHLTMSGAAIYNIKTIKNFVDNDVSLYKNFPQMALIIDYMINHNFKLLWINNKSLFGNKNKISYWSNNIFEVFLNDLESTLKTTNLPDKYIVKLIRDHSINSQIFNINKLIKYRSKGIYNIQKLVIFHKKIRLYTNTSITLAFLVAAINKRIIKSLVNIFKY